MERRDRNGDSVCITRTEPEREQEAWPHLAGEDHSAHWRGAEPRNKHHQLCYNHDIRGWGWGQHVSPQPQAGSSPAKHPSHVSRSLCIKDTY